uniref:UNC-45/Cro1/She4 central domain-containing protein n=1 Tax=Oryza punctata TaxID=4537 RepID=A0A0E0JJM2_ORYPU
MIFVCARLAAVIGTITICSLRLKRQDYVDPIYKHSDDHRNIRLAVSMNLVTFAKELVHTDSIEDQLIGFRILEHILRCNKMYQRMARKKIRASPGIIQMAVHKLGSKRDTDEDARGHAALVLLELAPDLQVDSFPGVLTAISSLLGTKKEDITSGSFSSPTKVSKEFQLLGLQILEKLADNPENCAKVNDAKDHLIPRVIHHTSCIGGRMDCEIDMEIVHTSLKTLHKLVTTAGEAADELRRQVSKDPRFMENIRKIIIGHTEGEPQLLVQATGILALLALDCMARNEIKRSRGIIQKLISFLAGEIDAVEDHILRKLQGSASEALVLLATPFKEREKIVLSTVSESSVQAILAETKLEDMENIVHILYNESAEHRIIVGKLLHNLRAYRGAEFAELLKKIDQALPKVLQIIKLSVERVESDSSNEHASHLYSSEGKLLESFIGLTVQICTNNDEMFFTDALTTANITVDMDKKGVGVFEHDEHISSIVNKSLKLIDKLEGYV